MTETTLSPCPFCGGPAKLVDCDERWIECMDCEASTGAYGTQDAAVAAWNRRDKLDSLMEEVKEALAELEESLNIQPPSTDTSDQPETESV